ncbi:DUF2384 domain-containing protein [Pseudoalteromonas sp. 78C3]|uniref:MbcA/ParS/Xre antitoxin family protein n=1 Tax=Pseudoalteromonas sp. 78C3 TaxID=2058300 RepID=UPI000C33958E|nr:MbcA/ParS/Xre antitoxin family protein [Pseudoalteromonas sp. 78C3]PKH92137.1 DUF2384 domain-containing protein [Pseudoalteromonas sp. 78C3]
MDKHTNNILQQDPRKAARVALKVFLNIMDAWGVNLDQRQVLLGSPKNSEFEQWQQGNVETMNRDVVIRISYIIGIYKGLGLTFNDRIWADKWVNKPNPEFNGQSALDFMLSGNIEQLKQVREFVDGPFNFIH